MSVLSEKILSDNIIKLIAKLELSSDSKPNWHDFLKSLITLSKANSLYLSCSNASIAHNTALQVGEESSKAHHYSINKKFKDWTYTLSFFFENQPTLAKFKNQSPIIEASVKIPMELALNSFDHHINHMAISSCLENSGLGILHIDNHARIIKSNHIANNIIKLGHLKLRHDKVFIASNSLWLKERIDNPTSKITANISSSSEELREKQKSYINLPIGKQALHCLLTPPDTNQFYYLLLLHLNSRQILPETLKKLLHISSSQAEIITGFMQGASAKQVSEQTGYSVSTVYSYIKNLYKEKEISSQAQLTATLLPELPYISNHN